MKITEREFLKLKEKALAIMPWVTGCVFEARRAGTSRDSLIRLVEEVWDDYQEQIDAWRKELGLEPEKKGTESP